MANEKRINDLDAAIRGEESTEKLKKDWHFENENDKQLNIETAIYPNGNQVKRFTISTGEEVMVRELLGGDSLEINKLLGEEKDESLRTANYLDSMFHFAVKINGKPIPMEDFKQFKLKDYNRILSAVQSLNF